MECLGTEAQIVMENNHCVCPCSCPQYVPDPIAVFNINGKQVGYSWNYGDSVELDIDIQNTVLRVDEEHVDELEVYLQNKEIEMNFINMRGEICYTFYLHAGLQSSIRLNTNEENLIAKNTYTCTLVLINPSDFSRINLLVEPYKIFVK